MLSFFTHSNRQNPTILNDQQAQLASNEAMGLKRRKHGEGVTFEELRKHNTRNDCWLLIDGKAYDVTSWIPKHPGGEVLLSYAGMDATDVFDAFHDETSEKFLPPLLIGPVIDADSIITDVVREHRALVKKLKMAGSYSSSKLYYCYKILSNFLIWGLAVYLLASYQGTLRVIVAGSLIALFWQQCGWVCHDTLHHQIFKNRRYNDGIAYFVGLVPVGYSPSWWKAKHNLHHAVPNVAGFDPDIDTMPLLAWSEKFIEGELSGLPAIMIKYQYIFYFPLLAAARLSWLMQSIIYAHSKSKSPKKELTGLAVHWFWYFSLMILYMGIKESLLFILFSQGIGGLLIAMAFSLNHNGMHIIEKQPNYEFNHLQITTARDIHGGLLNWAHWFMGGLDMQIEHHLFPRIPRHNLKELQGDVMAYCKKHGIHYHTTNFWTGTKELLGRLYTVSNAVK